ncbi:MAG TPA: PGPGW domain-containing protein [Solirubrobacteraceae bacterium]|nr:PGPGW domain-containing protein [Solirubrobacteraceae bacterium]
MQKLKAVLDRPHDEVMKDLHHRRRQQRNRNLVVRALVVVGASVLALGGVVMTVLPGPKLPAVALGVYLLAFEFAWAERLVAWTLRKIEAAKRRYEGAGPVKKYGAVVLAILALVGFVVAFRLLTSAARDALS